MFSCFSEAIPTTYQDALSNLEVLRMLVKKNDEIINYFNSIDNKIDEKILQAVAQYIAETDQKITTLERFVNTNVEYLQNYVNEKTIEIDTELNNKFDNFVLTQNINFNNYKNNVNSQIAQQNETINTQFVNFQNQLNALSYRISTEISILRNYIDIQNGIQNENLYNKLQDVYEFIEDLEFQLPEIDNIVKGGRDSIQNVIADVYNAIRYEAFTANEFDSRGLTVTEFDSSNITAENYDTEGRRIFGVYEHGLYMFNPFTNNPHDYIGNVVLMAIQGGNFAITATDFASKELTATQFDNLLITAYTYDYNAERIL